MIVENFTQSTFTIDQGFARKQWFCGWPTIIVQIGYLDINSLRNKINDLRLIMEDINLDYLVINETKLDATFSIA